MLGMQMTEPPVSGSDDDVGYHSGENSNPSSLFEVKVKRHERFELELKVFGGGEFLLDKDIEVSACLTAPMSLGKLSKAKFAENCWVLTRFGFGTNLSLSEAVEMESRWEDLVRFCDRLRTTTSIDAEDPTQPLSLEIFADFEQQIRLLGSLLKSAIRDETCNVKNQRKSPQNVLRDFKRLRQKVMELKSSVRRADVAVTNETHLELASKFEDFVFVEISNACAKICKFLPFGPELDAFTDFGLDLQDELRTSWGSERYLNPNFESDNETFLSHWHELKHYFLSALYLFQKDESPSMLWTDFVGMFFAGLAMVVAVMIMWAAEANMPRFTVEMLVVFTLGYILKDRLKEWGKRYFIPLFKLPDRMTRLNLIYGTGKHEKVTHIGHSDEWFSVSARKDTSEINYVLRASARTTPSRNLNDVRRAPRPENEFRYKRRINLVGYQWKRELERFIGMGNQQVTLVQLIRFDLSNFTARMGDPRVSVSHIDPTTRKPISVPCALRYQFRLQVSVALSPHKRKYSCANPFKKPKPKTVFSARFYIVMDQNGIQRISKRFESTENFV